MQKNNFENGYFWEIEANSIKNWCDRNSNLISSVNYKGNINKCREIFKKNLKKKKINTERLSL